MLAEFDEETIKSSAALGINVASLGLSVLDSGVDELLICGLVRRGENEGLEVDRPQLRR